MPPLLFTLLCVQNDESLHRSRDQDPSGPYIWGDTTATHLRLLECPARQLESRFRLIVLWHRRSTTRSTCPRACIDGRVQILSHVWTGIRERSHCGVYAEAALPGTIDGSNGVAVRSYVKNISAVFAFKSHYPSLVGPVQNYTAPASGSQTGGRQFLLSRLEHFSFCITLSLSGTLQVYPVGRSALRVAIIACRSQMFAFDLLDSAKEVANLPGLSVSMATLLIPVRLGTHCAVLGLARVRPVRAMPWRSTATTDGGEPGGSRAMKRPGLDLPRDAVTTAGRSCRWR